MFQPWREPKKIPKCDRAPFIGQGEFPIFWPGFQEYPIHHFLGVISINSTQVLSSHAFPGHDVWMMFLWKPPFTDEFPSYKSPFVDDDFYKNLNKAGIFQPAILNARSSLRISTVYIRSQLWTRATTCWKSKVKHLPSTKYMEASTSKKVWVRTDMEMVG